MKPRRLLLAAISLGIYGFIYLPLLIVMLYSFNAARFGAGWGGFSFEWYGKLWENEMAARAASNTLIIAGCSTLVSTLIGTLLGVGLSRHEFPGRRYIAWLLYLPVVIPDVVMAVALLLFFHLVRDWIGFFDLGFATMIPAHITFQIPFVAIVVRARLAGIDPALEEAAHDLGADSWRTFRYVTLPLILPGVVAGALLAFTLSFDDFVISFFTSGPGSTTLPILIYSSVRRGITPDINALSTMMVIASVILTLTVTKFQKK